MNWRASLAMPNDPQQVATQPVGSVVQAPYGYSQPGQTWLRCDGSIITRGQYPQLSALLSQVGVFTPTKRTGATIAGTAVIATNGANLVIGGASGTAGIQYSFNGGVSWASATTPTGFASSLINAGANFFATLNGGGGIISPSNTGSGIWPASTGTAIPGGATSCAANGTGTVIVPSGDLYQSTNYGASFSAGFNVNGGGPPNGTPIIWTGSTFIVFSLGNTVGTGYGASTTGNSGSWATTFSAPWGAQAVSSAASDGNGNVLAVVGASSVAYVSNNSGITWRSSLLPGNADGGVNAASYANGRWFVSLLTPVGPSNSYADGSVAVSADLMSWVLAQQFGVPSFSANASSQKPVSYALGNYCSVDTSGNILTLSENTTQMYLPMSRRLYGVQTDNWQEWIRAS